MAVLGDSPVDVVLEYVPHSHLAQLYSGFQALEAQRVVKCHWLPASRGDANWNPRFSVILNDQVQVTYDTLDGINWTNGDWNQNLEHFHRTAPVGYYFKRSYHSDLLDAAPSGCIVLPLGLNYQVSPPYVPTPLSPYHSFGRFARNLWLSRRLLNTNGQIFSENEFLAGPQLSGEDRVLLYTRLWDPDGRDVATQIQHDERLKMNAMRINLISVCKQEFGKQFTGGIQSDSYSRTQVPADSLLPWSATQKQAYLETVKRHSICIATTGLHGSIGWSFAEYVAASRAVVTESLLFGVGANFNRGDNYLEFTDSHSLVETINYLLTDRARVVQMMEANRRYYWSFLRPDALVLNTLIQALGLSDERPIENR